MCGISGYLSVEAGRVAQSVLSRMTDQIAHRGPDGSGFYSDEFASLGHRRLSIIDLEGGAQPMYNEDRSLVIVYNGEVFNHASIRPLLELEGHRYNSRCDTETLIHGYEQWGPDSLTRYRGMFSFAIWDPAKRELFCARDRLGIKPFYYFFNGSDFVFGSEIKALLQHPATTAQMDCQGLSEYLTFGYRNSNETLFQGIRQLPAGHWLKARLSNNSWKIQIHPYWDAPIVPATASEDPIDWIRECRDRLESTVEMRLMSDVPLGVFLSGGVDSSAIAAIMKNLVREPINTFAVGYDEAQYSELGFARQVANHLGTKHHEVSLSKEAFFRYLPHVVWHEDEPVTWPSSVSLYLVSQLASRHVKVVLTGEGSDELFGGYARYRHFLQGSSLSALANTLPGAIRGLLRKTIETSSLLNADLRRKLQHTAFGRDNSFEALYLDNYYAAFSRDEAYSLLQDASTDPYKPFMQMIERARSATPLGQLLYADQKTYLSELLRKQDRMSMASSIESRVPFLDHTFTEFSARVPDHLKIHGKEGKAVIKQAVCNLLPRSIVYRTKMGFPTPIRNWLRGATLQAVRGLVCSRDGLAQQHFDMPAVTGLFDRHEAGQIDGTDRIWRLLTLEVWRQIFIQGKHPNDIGVALR